MINYKNILITGASSGLGKAIALNYSNKNTTLYLLGRNEERLFEVKKECENKGATVYTKIIDVRNRQEMNDYLQDIDVDLVFANAGVSGGTTSNNEYEIFDTNIIGVLNTITPIIEKMKKIRSGRIVIISSMASFRGIASAPAYSASKACVRYYGEALNNYLKKDYNIDVNVYCPAFIKTPLTDHNKFSMPLIMSPEKAVEIMNKGLKKNKKFIIYPKCFYYGMKLLNILPFGLDDFIYSRLPRK